MEAGASAPLPPLAVGRGTFERSSNGGGWGTMSDRTPRPIDKRVPRARGLRRDATYAEKKLWQYLRRISPGRSHFRRQATIGPYFADFACHQTRILIEVDGGQHADSTTDAKRTSYLEANGYRVLRFWNNEVLGNIEGVLEVISEAVAGEGPHPRPLPTASGGRGVTAIAAYGRGGEQRSWAAS
jgi:very-short-patch-repair endonuclease